MTIPHIKQHLNRAILNVDSLSKTAGPAGQTAPQEAKQAPGLGRIGAAPAGPGRATRPITFTILAILGTAVFATAISVEQVFTVPSPQCNTDTTLTRLDDESFAYLEWTTDTTGDADADQYFVRTHPNSIEERFRVFRGDIEPVTGDACTDALQDGGAMNLVQFSDGDIAYVNSGATDYSRALDAGFTWTDVTFPAGPLDSSICTNVYWVMVSDTVWGFLYGKTVSGNCRPHVRSTTDAATTWDTAIQVSTMTVNNLPDVMKMWESEDAGNYILHIGGCQLYYYDTASDTATVRGTSPSNQHKISGQTAGCNSNAEDNLASRVTRTNDGTLWFHNVGDGQLPSTLDSYLWYSDNEGITWNLETRLTVESWTTLETFLFTDGTNLYPFRSVDGIDFEGGIYTIDGFTSFESSGMEVPDSISGLFIADAGGIVVQGQDDGRAESIGNAFIGVINMESGAAFNQIPVTGLTQADVDNTGTVIIARVDAGETIETYNAFTLGLLGTDTTPDCPIYAGVSSIRTSRDYYVSYGACDGTGNVDTLWVKSEFLTAPNFGDCDTDFCQEQNEQFNTIGGTPFDVPADIHALGTISAVPYSFEEFNQFNFANGYAAWTFSTLSGEIGILGVAYNEAAADNGDRDLVSVSPGSDIYSFCSWRNPDNDQDYIAGVSNGPTILAEAEANIEHAGIGNDDTVDVSATAVLVNNVPYGNAVSISCTEDKMLVGTGTEVFLVNITETFGVTTDEIAWEEPAQGFTINEVAISPNGLFGAWRDGGQVRIVSIGNHTTLETVAVPSGTWRGIEFDQKGGQLFIYTSDFITIYDVSQSTCQNDCSADENEFAEPLGETPDDEGGSEGGLGELIGNPYFWILVAILVVEVAIAALSWGTRAGFGGIVYLIGGMVVYIAGMIIDQADGISEVSPWPIVAILAAIIGLAIAGFVRR